MKNLYIAICIPFICCCSCEGNDHPLDDRPNQPADVTLEEQIVPPSIPVIDESDYTVYYVDAENGNDTNDGLSETAPFKTLSKITYMEKVPKMKVLLKSGSVFAENIVLKNLKGSADKPFIMDIYGGTERPTISGTGDQAVLIQDDNMRFRNIRVTNKTGTRGIRIQTQIKGAGAFLNVEITGCLIEEVNWAGDIPFENVDPETIDVEAIAPGNRFSNKEFGGIIIENATTKEQGASWYENLFITNNVIRQVCRTGILVQGKWGQRDKPGNGLNEYISDEQNWYPSKNVVIQGNDFSYCGGDGLILMGSTNSYIDHNRCFHANFLGRGGQASAGLWPYSCTNIVMQYNEAAYTWLAHGSADGQGLDVDIACKNTLVQYNYVHHNKGGGILLCNISEGDHSGTVIRNNVFYKNDGSYRGSLMTVSSNVGMTDVYNNTVVLDNGTSPVIIFTDDWAQGGKSHDFSYRNNIFVSMTPCTGKIDIHNMEKYSFENNLFFHVGSSFMVDASPLRYDPKIKAPVSSNGFDKAMQFHPAEPKIFTDGLSFDGMADTDFGGNPVQGINYLGAFAQ